MLTCAVCKCSKMILLCMWEVELHKPQISQTNGKKQRIRVVLCWMLFLNKFNITHVYIYFNSFVKREVGLICKLPIEYPIIRGEEKRFGISSDPELMV